ncbi:hypothetical protein Tco_0366930 [Tanacetum coccineum]
MEHYEDEDDCFTNFESESPTIVLDDTSREALSWEPMVSPLNNNQIEFRISLDESDDEDYTLDRTAMTSNPFTGTLLKL